MIVFRRNLYLDLLLGAGFYWRSRLEQDEEDKTLISDSDRDSDELYHSNEKCNSVLLGTWKISKWEKVKKKWKK